MPPSVVLVVPTYRRPALLARLLDSLAPEIGRGTPVIVGDNDCDEEAPRVVAAADLDATCVAVPEPGLSAVRNALIREATARHPGWDVMVMLDDDGYVTPGWYAALLRAVEEYGADVTGGPVDGDLPPEAGLLARNSIYAGRTNHAAGPVGMLNGAQNLAVRRRILDRLGDPWFAPHLGRSGGEDHQFFRRVLAEGGTLAWAADAVVVEPTPMERLSPRALVLRAYRSNRTLASTDISFRGRGDVARRLVVDTGWLIRNVGVATLRRDRDGLARSALGAAALTGRAVGLATGRATTAVHASA